MRHKYLPITVLAATLLAGGPGIAFAQNNTAPANPPAAAGPVAPANTAPAGGGGGGLWGLIGLIGLLGLGGWRSRSRPLPPTTTGVTPGVGPTTDRL